MLNWLKKHLIFKKPSLKTPENAESSFNVVQNHPRTRFQYRIGSVEAWKLDALAKAQNRHIGETLEIMINEEWERKKNIAAGKLSPQKLRRSLTRKIKRVTG